MNTRRLEAFLAIVRCGSFAAAASQLCATQSAISIRIVELELELGVTLFDRSKRKARLTDQGRLLVAHAERIVSAVSEMKYDIGDEAAMSVTIRLGIAELIAVTWLPALVRQLKERFPQLKLQIEVNVTRRLVDRLHAGQLDVIMAPGIAPDATLEVVSLGTVAFRWLAARGLESKAPGGGDPLENLPILLLESESFVYSLAQTFFRGHGIAPMRVDTCNSMGVLAALTNAGLGVSLLPLLYYQDEIDRGNLRVIDTDTDGLVGDFTAVFSSRPSNLMARLVAKAAGDVSGFGRNLFGKTSSYDESRNDRLIVADAPREHICDSDHLQQQ